MFFILFSPVVSVNPLKIPIRLIHGNRVGIVTVSHTRQVSNANQPQPSSHSESLLVAAHRDYREHRYS